ncbi:MAG: four helix bundle protein [Bacteroidota bacterium]
MRNFKELKIWQKGMEIAASVYRNVLDALPSTEKYGLRSQISRAAVSIPSNVAEGSSRRSDKDYARFIEISLGSSYELETQLLISKELQLADQKSLDGVLIDLEEQQKMLSAFLSKLRA